jgi:hypothetical protein
MRSIKAPWPKLKRPHQKQQQKNMILIFNQSQSVWSQHQQNWNGPNCIDAQQIGHNIYK